MSNVEIFRNYLQKEDLHMEEVKGEEGIFFRTRQSFDNGGTVMVLVNFNAEEDLVDLDVYGVATVKDPLKKEAALKLINQLNTDYRWAKFYEVDGMVSIRYSYQLVKNELNPGLLLDTTVSLLNSAEASYPKFMKLQWA